MNRREFLSTLRVRRDGTGVEQLTGGTMHSGVPSYSADGKPFNIQPLRRHDVLAPNRTTRALGRKCGRMLSRAGCDA